MTQGMKESWWRLLPGFGRYEPPIDEDKRQFTPEDKLNAEVRKLTLEVKLLRRQGILTAATLVTAVGGVLLQASLSSFSYRSAQVKVEEASLETKRTEMRIWKLRRDSIALAGDVDTKRKELGRLQAELASIDSAARAAQTALGSANAGIGSLPAGVRSQAALALQPLNEAFSQLRSLNRDVAALAVSTDQALAVGEKLVTEAPALSRFRIGLYFDPTNDAAVHKVEELEDALKRSRQVTDVVRYPSLRTTFGRLGVRQGMEVRHNDDELRVANELQRLLAPANGGQNPRLIRVGTRTYRFLSVFVSP